MESWEVLRDATETVGAKAVAGNLHLSTALIYKWCQPPRTPASGASGALNPLDRVRKLYEVTGDQRLVAWLCRVAGGFFVPNPRPEPTKRNGQLLSQTQRVVNAFSQLLTDISRSIENDGVISPAEAETIRQAWERLKTQGESFVVECERGMFSHAARR